MTWHPAVPLHIVDERRIRWLVERAWPDTAPGDYVLEVRAPGRAGVRAAHLRHGRFELVPRDDPGLPSLAAESHAGEIIAHRAHKRAVLRADASYIKIFRPGRAVLAAERCAQMDALLAPDTFAAPRIMRRSRDVLVFSALRGRTMLEVGKDQSTVSDESFAQLWAEWARAWTAQLGAPSGAAERSAEAGLPLRSAEVEAANLWIWVNRWLRHSENAPEAWFLRDALRARAEEVSTNLLGTAPDPLVWAHGDLHDKQIIGSPGRTPLGLLDFDEAAQAEAALDLANLDVHLTLRLSQGVLTPERHRVAHSQVLVTAGGLQVSPSRFQAYSDSTRLRLACLYSFRPRWTSLAQELLEEQIAGVKDALTMDYPAS
ncbi:phosphotransferase [Pseudarthrobacter sp. P1]|uniref:phosphotransferase n=1 Tax=Pseudarthrobacter sp. P1 TaxID=3418418 RepID=UPI003CFB1470